MVMIKIISHKYLSLLSLDFICNWISSKTFLMMRKKRYLWDIISIITFDFELRDLRRLNTHISYQIYNPFWSTYYLENQVREIICYSEYEKLSGTYSLVDLTFSYIEEKRRKNDSKLIWNKFEWTWSRWIKVFKSKVQQ